MKELIVENATLKRNNAELKRLLDGGNSIRYRFLRRVLLPYTVPCGPVLRTEEEFDDWVDSHLLPKESQCSSQS